MTRPSYVARLVTAAFAVVVAVGAPATAHARGHCRDASPVLGRRTCGGFGRRWSHSALDGMLLGPENLELGFLRLPVPTSALEQHGTLYSASGSLPYRTALAAGSRRVLWAAGLRVQTGYEGRHVIAIAELELGMPLAAPTVVTVLEGQPTATSSQVYDLAGAGVVGAHTRVGQLDLAGLVALGYRDLSVPVNAPAGYTSCVGGLIGKTCGVGAVAGAPLVELRSRVALWATRNLTVGVVGGFDLVRHGASAMLEVRMHFTPYDGN